jgi:hypothetical protein
MNRGSNLMMVDLPLPDSPTIPTVSPALMVNVTSCVDHRYDDVLVAFLQAPRFLGAHHAESPGQGDVRIFTASLQCCGFIRSNPLLGFQRFLRLMDGQ